MSLQLLKHIHLSCKNTAGRATVIIIIIIIITDLYSAFRSEDTEVTDD